MSIQHTTALPATMGLLSQSVTRLSDEQNAQQAALASGVSSDSYAGIGSERYVALDLQPQLTQVASWRGNITTAQTTLSVTQTALSRITTIATNLTTSLTSVSSGNSVGNVADAAAAARQALSSLGTILNTTNGSQFVFGGNAASTAPVTDPQAITSSDFFRSIQASVASLASTGAQGVEDATVAAAADNSSTGSPFSSALSTDASTASGLARTLEVGSGQHVAAGFVATAGSSPTATSTGSVIRDLMRVLAVVGSLDKAGTSTQGLSDLVRDTTVQMSAINTGLAAVTASIGQTQKDLGVQDAALEQTSTAFTTQLSAVKDVDAASLSVQLTNTQSRLQASYSLIADMKGMSLAAYL